MLLTKALKYSKSQPSLSYHSKGDNKLNTSKNGGISSVFQPNQIDLDLIRKESLNSDQLLFTDNNNKIKQKHSESRSTSSCFSLDNNNNSELINDNKNHKQTVKGTIMEKFLQLTTVPSSNKSSISSLPHAINNNSEPTVIVDHLYYSVLERKKLFKPKEKITVLSDVSFYLKPGMMVLLLGGPSSGKSTLFKCLVNRIPSRGTINGDILFNGHQIDEKTHHTQYIYVPQMDNHIPTLTVRETLDFSIDCQSSLSNEKKAELRQVILEMLGLKHVEDTIIGSQSLRGISGGQKKRMTVAVELFKGAKSIFMDEATSGLDSTTSYELFSSIKMISQSAGVPVMASLLQPSQEIYSLFTHILMIKDGKITFFGAKDQVLPFYKHFGLNCPKTQNPAEFLSNIYEISKLNKSVQLKSTDDFITAYTTSKVYFDNLNTIREETLNSKKKLANEEIIEKPVLFQNSILNQIRLCIKRAFVMTFRDRPALTSRFLKSIILGLLIGSLFFSVGNNQKSTQLLPSLTFFLLTFVVFGSLAGVQQLFVERPVFYDQQYGKYYHSFAYFSAGVVCDLFWNFIDIFIFTNLAYWMIGLSANFSKYLFFMLLIFILDSLVIRTAKAVSVFSSTPIIASTIAPTYFCLLLLMAGYIIPMVTIPSYWRWLHYLSPFKWGYEALLINEVSGRTYICEDNELMPPIDNPLLNVSYPYGYQGGRICPTTTGDQLLKSKDITTDFSYRYNAIFILIAMYLFALVLSLIGMRYFRFDTYPHNPPAITPASLERQQRLLRRSTSGVAAIKKNASDACFLSFHNLSYCVPITKVGGNRVIRTLLDNVNGYVAPGTLVALMGSSGAGKSTLMDILSNRTKNGQITGDILINGKPRDKYYNRYIAYVEQEDRLPSNQTVREAITFSAMLRLSSDVTIAQKNDVVCYILDVLELIGLADVLIGTPEDGISMEQRKRVNIGMELASNPDILFLDEPTTGLDSVSAQKIMSLVKKIASNGRSVICTLHQPSEAIFQLFDSILLLTQGGYTAYFGQVGENASTVLNYCKQFGYECPSNKNPADFLLDFSSSIKLQERIAAHDKPYQSRLNWLLKITRVFKRHSNSQQQESTKSNHSKIEMDAIDGCDSGTGDDEEMNLGSSSSSSNYDVIDYYLNSDQYKSNLSILSSETAHSKYTTKQFTRKYASKFTNQFVYLMVRSFITTWRKKNVILTRCLRSILLAFITGTLFWQIKSDQEGVYDRISFIFFSSTFASISCLSNIPSMFEERPLWYRELDSGTYRHLAFVLTMIISDMPLTMIYSCLFSAPVYWMAGLAADGHRFLLFMLVYYLYVQTLISFSQLLGIICPNMSVANEVTGIVFSVFSLFAGFIIRKSFIPKYFKFFYQISFTRYAVETLTVNEMNSDILFSCKPGQFIPIPVRLNETLTVIKPFCPIPNGETVLKIFDLPKSATKDNSYTLLSIFIVFIILILISSRIFKFKK